MRHAPFLQFILSKHGNPHRKETQVFELFAYPTLSSHFLPFLVLSCFSLSFPVLWWTGERYDTGTHGRTDIRTYGHTDVRTYGRMYGQKELSLIRCLQKKKWGWHTHGQTSYFIIIIDGFEKRLNNLNLVKCTMNNKEESIVKFQKENSHYKKNSVFFTK